VSPAEWNNLNGTVIDTLSCDEMIATPIYSGDYGLVTDSFTNTSGIPEYLLKYKWRVRNPNSYILRNNTLVHGTLPGTSIAGIVARNYPHLGAYVSAGKTWFRINPGQSIRHLTTAEEISEWWDTASFEYGMRTFFNPISIGGIPPFVANNANYRSNGHPSTPTVLTLNPNTFDAQYRFVTLYDTDGNFEWTETNNTAIIECNNVVLRRCGDGKIGLEDINGNIVNTKWEQCDEWSLNGQPWHCNLNCTTPVSDIQVTKDVSSATVNPNGTVTWTIRVKNLGPSTATNVIVNDDLPAGLSIVWFPTVSQWWYNSTYGEWTIGTLTANQEVTMTITTTVWASACNGTIINTVSLMTSSPTDTNTSNNTDTATVSCTPVSDIQVTKDVSSATVNPNGTVTWTIRVKNLGPSTATAVKVNDDLPAGLSIVWSPTVSQGSYNTSNGEWTIGTLTANQEVTMTITTTVWASACNGTIINTVSLMTSSPTDTNNANNTDTASVSCTPVSDIQVTKDVSSATVNPNGTVTWTIRVKNLGPSTATAVKVNDDLPAGLSIVWSPTVSQGSYNTSNGEWTIGTLTANQEVTMTITTTVWASACNGTIINTVSLMTSSPTDTNNANNTDTASVSCTPVSDIQVTKDVSSATVNPNGTVTWTIRVKNLGPSTATAVKVNDDLPAGLSIVWSPTVSQGSYNTSNGEWTIGTLTANQEVTMTITTTVWASACNGTIVNTVSLMTSSPTDTNNANNTDTASVSCTPVSDIQVTKDVSSATVNPNGTVTWTIRVKNLGPSTATAVKVNDDLPAGLSIVWSPTVSQGSYNTSNGEWTIGTLTANQEVTMTITTTVWASACNGTIVNTVSLMTSSPTDTNNANNTDTASVSCTPVSDIQVTKDVSSATVNPNGTVTWTIRVKNLGPSTATAVKVNDDLPAGLSIVWSPTVSQGSYNTSNGEWTIGTLTANQEVTMTITTTVWASACNGTIINTVSLMTSSPTDTNNANNTDTASVSCTPVSDIQVTKDVSSATVNPNGTVTWTIRVKNLGPSTATAVKVNDDLPAGLSIVWTPTVSQGSYNTSNGEWTIGTLTANQEVTMTITTTVWASACNGTIINTVSLMTSSPTDTNNANNTDTASVSCTPVSDIQVTKDVSSATVNPNGTVTWTIRVKNLGPSTATAVKINDDLPAGLSIVWSPTVSQGSYNTSNGEWTIGTLTANQEVTMTITTTVWASACNGTIINTVSLMTSSPTDTNNANNTDTASVSCQWFIDLNLTKTVNNANPQVGQNVTFTITVSNSGNVNANNFTVQDILPAWLTFVSATPSATQNGQTLTWNVSSLGVNQSTTFTVVATVATVWTHTNFAQVCNYEETGEPQDADSSPDCNVQTNNEDDEDEVSISCTPVPVFDLSLDKDFLGTSAAFVVGDQIWFKITITNSGNTTVNNFQVKDYLPTDLTFVSASHDGIHIWGTVTWTLSLAPNQSIIVYMTWLATANPGSHINGAEICNYTGVSASTNPHDIDSNPCNGVNANEDDDDTVIFTCGPAPVIDLNLTKTVNNPNPQVGQNVTFTITVGNSGNVNANNFTVQDILPAWLTFVSATPSATQNGQTLTWNVSSLGVNQSTTFTVVATVATVWTHTNFAQVCNYEETGEPQDADSSPDCNVQTNNEDDEDEVSISCTPVPVFDLSLDKDFLGTSAAFVVGDQIWFKITITNSGNTTVNNFQVKDYLPTDLTFVSASHDGIHIWGTVTWTLSLAPNQSIIVYMTWLATANPGSHINGAEICNYTGVSASTNPHDIDSNPCNGVNANEDDDDTVIFTCGPAPVIDLNLTKTVNNPNPQVGQNVTFTITVGNSGNVNANNFTVQDILPAWLTFVSATPSATQNGQTLTWNVSSLGVNQSTTFTVVATVATVWTHTNFAQVCNYEETGEPQDADSSPDCNVQTNNEDDEDEVSISCTPVPVFDLSLDKDFLGTSAAFVVGDQIWFKITITNSGNTTVNNFQVKDYLPTDLTFVSASHDGIHIWGTVTWTLSLAPNQSIIVYMTWLATANPGSHINGAEICNYTGVSASTNPHDIDSNPCNGVNANEDDDDTVIFTCGPTPVIDLNLTKTSTSTQVAYSGLVTYTIQVTNTGNTTVSGLSIVDTLPSGMDIVSCSPNCSTTSVTTATRSLTSVVLIPGATYTVNLTTIAKSTTATGYLNQACVSTAWDSVLSNNCDDHPITTSPISCTNLSFTSMLYENTCTPGQNINLTCTWVNVSTGYIVIKSWSTILSTLYGLTWSYTFAQWGSYTAQCFVDNNITSSGCTQIINITQQIPDIRVVKQANATNYISGDLVTYTITYSNIWSGTTTGFVIKDTLPQGISFVSSNKPSATIGNEITRLITGTFGPWGIGSIILTGKISTWWEANALLYNTACATGVIWETNLSNNCSTAHIYVNPVSCKQLNFASLTGNAPFTTTYSCTGDNVTTWYIMVFKNNILYTGHLWLNGSLTLFDTGTYTAKCYVDYNVNYYCSASATQNTSSTNSTTTTTNTTTKLADHIAALRRLEMIQKQYDSVTGVLKTRLQNDLNRYRALVLQYENASVWSQNAWSTSSSLIRPPASVCNKVYSWCVKTLIVNGTSTALQYPDITVTKTALKYQYAPSEQVNYTLTVTNIWSWVATGIQIVDTLPVWLSYISSSPIASTTGQTIVRNLTGTILLPGQSITHTLVAQITGMVPLTMTTYTNTVAVATSWETNTTNNTASTGILVVFGWGWGSSSSSTSAWGGSYTPLCGNGNVDTAVWEQCDPKSSQVLSGWQSCSADCRINKLAICGNNIQELWEYCDMGNNGWTISYGSNKWLVCTRSCTIESVLLSGELPKCSQIDPPSIQEGEYLPMRWNLEQTNNNIHITTQCTSTNDVWKIKSDANTLKCNLEIYNAKNGKTSTTPIATMQVDCLKNSLQWVKLFQAFAKEISSSDGSAQYFFTKDKIGWVYGEYKVVLKSVVAQECISITNGSGVKYQFETRTSHDRMCAFNFAITKPYMMIQWSVNGLWSTLHHFDKFYGFGQNNELFQQLEAKEVPQTTRKLSQEEYKNLFEKYINLAITYVPDSESPFDGNNALGKIYKVPGKYIYVLEAPTSNGFLTIQQTKDIGVPYTIIVKKGHLYIKNNLKGKGMYVNMDGNMYFNTHDSNSTNRCPTQYINGIFVVTKWVFDTQNLEYNDKSASLTNDRTEKRRCQEGNLIVNGVLIWDGIDNLVTKRRSHLNNWFDASVSRVADREDLIYKGASLLIQTNPSLWTNLPPLANELTNQLKLQKN
jgi:uncharacterized repeat protein (TIGR01451 family)